ncbi:hypothetical protein JHK85_008211 [Glycine max]|nr:hypothetical protein JHK85_008211 [Glycine max]
MNCPTVHALLVPLLFKSTRAAPMHSFDELKDHTWSRGNPYLSRRYHFESFRVLDDSIEHWLSIYRS